MTRKTTLLVCLFVAGVATAQMKKDATTGSTQGAAARMPVTASPQANQQARIDAVRRVTVLEAQKLAQTGQAVIVDVRSSQQFSEGHIRGAVNIPGSQLLARLGELPPKTLIITYCACSAEQSSGKAVLDLNAHGVAHAAAMKGGWAAWKKAGLPVSTGAK